MSFSSSCCSILPLLPRAVAKAIEETEEAAAVAEEVVLEVAEAEEEKVDDDGDVDEAG